jgi:hypothetical protein
VQGVYRSWFCAGALLVLVSSRSFGGARMIDFTISIARARAKTK